MEFYALFFRRDATESVVSIPNGMEFYSSLFRKRQQILVSIPNGMEFYCSVCILCLEILMVSIPNGMEFYFSQALPQSAVDSRFNSQRDGILP